MAAIGDIICDKGFPTIICFQACLIYIPHDAAHTLSLLTRAPQHKCLVSWSTMSFYFSISESGFGILLATGSEHAKAEPSCLAGAGAHTR